MERTLEYYTTLSLNSKARYATKIAESGLKTDLYATLNKLWTEEPVAVPKVTWRDMFLHMISIPSPFVKQEMIYL